MTATHEIQSVGPPPERYADRVTAQMMHQLARTHASVWMAINEAVAASSDGGARAQRKMEERIKRAGALRTELTPGKRGRYTLIVHNIVGWDRARDAEVLVGDRVPERPQIACNVTVIRSEGRGRDLVKIRSRPMVLVTHHLMSRAAQRLGVRTSAHLVAATTAIWDAAIGLLCEKGGDVQAFLDAPPEGWRVAVRPIDGAVVVLRRHERRAALIAATVF